MSQTIFRLSFKQVLNNDNPHHQGNISVTRKQIKVPTASTFEFILTILLLSVATIGVTNTSKKIIAPPLDAIDKSLLILFTVIYIFTHQRIC